VNNPKSEGILLVDKEKGRTAFYLVKILRKLTGIQKIGHAGTLDPFATGVMVMLLGRPYTKIADSFLNDDKEYLATIKLGEGTDTFDCDGQTSKTSEKIPSLSEVEAAIAHFQGEILQTPPMFSAKKVNGQRLYTLARKGIEVERQEVKLKVQTTLIDYSYPELKIQVSCSKGTYIRSIANDIGMHLGCFGHLTALKRIRSGAFHLKDCIDAKSLSQPSFPYIPHLRKEL